MTGFNFGRAVDAFLGFFEIFNPIIEPYRRFHEKLPPKARQTAIEYVWIRPMPSAF